MVSHVKHKTCQQSRKCALANSKYCKKDTINLNVEDKMRMQRSRRDPDIYSFWRITAPLDKLYAEVVLRNDLASLTIVCFSINAYACGT